MKISKFGITGCFAIWIGDHVVAEMLNSLSPILGMRFGTLKSRSANVSVLNRLVEKRRMDVDDSHHLWLQQKQGEAAFVSREIRERRDSRVNGNQTGERASHARYLAQCQRVKPSPTISSSNATVPAEIATRS
jgi:hypothetical protein